MRTIASSPGGGLSFPSALNTGPAAAGYTSLTQYGAVSIPAAAPYPAYVQVQADGSLLVEGCQFNGTVSQRASNITFRGCAFTPGTSFYCVQPIGGPTNVTFEDCTAYPGTPGAQLDYAFYAGGLGLTVLRCDLWGFTLQPVESSFGNVLIQDNYFHDYQPTASAHAEPVYLGSVGTAGSMDNVVVRHNTLLAAPYNLQGVNNNTACIFMRGPTGSESFSFSNFLIEQNLLAGGSYAMYCGSIATSVSGIVVQDNWFSTLYGPKCGINGTHTNSPPWGTNGNIWQRNIWLDGPSAGTEIAG